MFDPGGAPGLLMGPCIVEIDCIVIRDVQNEEVNFQGSSANSDGRTAEITTKSRFLKKHGHKKTFKQRKMLLTNIIIEKTAPSPGGNVFPLITTIFKVIRHINKTNVLTKFYDDCPKNVT
ncbi:hypothetical protein DPMN_179750 [Dreissena polymorpha]|uniref:Uncharacterized protein n=1 Tax=Dreissena polymorpha TaxID=45954 RepID=A0A9D4IL20_DREPO|nr:hypothetical protein DPMN_179750 [Dreissena polymorpha]